MAYDLKTARTFAKAYSRKFCTFWYVRNVGPNEYEPRAHDSGDAYTVATFYCGEEQKFP